MDGFKPKTIDQLQGDVKAVYRVGRPDRRKRDIANLEKAPSDTLKRWGVLEDDSQIVDIRLLWCAATAPGMITVELEEQDLTHGVDILA